MPKCIKTNSENKIQEINEGNFPSPGESKIQKACTKNNIEKQREAMNKGMKESSEKAKMDKIIQKEKLILAKQKLEEAAKLFNELQPSTNYNKIKIDNLRDLVFKNNGNPTENGFIEFEDFFKDDFGMFGALVQENAGV